MPNYCYADIVIRGYKDNVDQLVREIQEDYAYHEVNGQFKRVLGTQPHFFRIFEGAVYDEEMYGLYKTVCMNIECAWSVWSCMFEGAHTYYTDTITTPEQYKPIADFPWLKRNKNDIKWVMRQRKEAAVYMLNATHIVWETYRLGLDVEIRSYEPGVGFSEHYRITNGVILVNDEQPYAEYPFYEPNDGSIKTRKEYCDYFGYTDEELPEELTDDEIKNRYESRDNMDFIICGGDGKYYMDTNDAIYTDKRLYNNVLCKIAKNKHIL